MMNPKQYDELRNANPFKPFRIFVSDGAVFEVPHRDFTWRTPKGSTIWVATADGEAAQIVDMLHITRFEVNGVAKSAPDRT